MSLLGRDVGRWGGGVGWVGLKDDIVIFAAWPFAESSRLGLGTVSGADVMVHSAVSLTAGRFGRLDF